jgi:hypothetical protein
MRFRYCVNSVLVYGFESDCARRNRIFGDCAAAADLPWRSGPASPPLVTFILSEPSYVSVEYGSGNLCPFGGAALGVSHDGPAS